jgi:glycerol-3-phosphate dehydrogenase (NAD(P)+)
MSRIAVLGAGSWGTALALNLCRRPDHTVTLWAHTPAHAAELAADQENRRYLPGFALPATLTVTDSLPQAVEGAAAILLVVPSQFVRETMRALVPALSTGSMLISAAKGIEEHTLLRMTEVMIEELVEGANTAAQHHPIGVLSGPSFAQEVAAGAPAAVTLAMARKSEAEQAQTLLTTETLRLYRNTDVAGVELGGALKNVIAIAAGAVAGLELGQNSAAALITRGIAEMTRLALACGGRQETLAGLAGVGDLVLTCTGGLSRNRFVGMELGRGRALAEIVSSLHGKVAEGVRTTDAALALARRHGVEMPITEEVHAVLHGKRSAADAVRSLMARPGRDE